MTKGKTYIHIDGANVRVGRLFEVTEVGIYRLREDGVEFTAFAEDLRPHTYENLMNAYAEAEATLKRSAVNHFRAFRDDVLREDWRATVDIQLEVTGREYAPVAIVEQPVGAQSQVA